MARTRKARYPTKGIAANARRLRAELGLSLNALAKRLGWRYQTLHKIESGKTRNPRLETVRALAKALGVTVDGLVGA